MSNQQRCGVALIGDPDRKFLQKITSDSSNFPAPPMLVSTRTELETKLRDSPEQYSGIFLNPRLNESSSVPLMHLVRSLCPTTPVFFILDSGDKLLNPGELAKLTVRDSLFKPLTFIEIQIALNLSGKFDPQSTLELASNDVEILNLEFEDSDEAFTPIRAKGFLAGRESYFHVYVRLNERKYVKILSAGEVFSHERLNTYLKRGTEKFYIRKKVQENYLKYCEALTDAIVGKPQLSAEVKVAQVMNWGDETASFLRAGGLNEGAINYARRFTKNVHGLVRDLKLDQIDPIRKYLESNQHFDHSAATVMIASLLAIPMKFESDRSTNMVGLSALFHDIGLEQMDKKFLAMDESILTEEEIREYHRHPIIGQDMLRELKGIEPIVIQAVGQHHERRTGKGFPYGLGASEINPVSEIIGISEELVRHMQLVIQNPSISLTKSMEESCANDFSATVFNTLKVFLR